MHLTEDEIAFLDRKGLSIDDVLCDYSNLTVKERKEIAEDEGKKLVLGSPCRRHGFRIRTRTNACVLCNPAALAFQERYSSPGYVYIAYSRTIDVFKIGSAKSFTDRENSLRNGAYAGVSDWEIIITSQVSNRGEIESKIKNRLSEYKTEELYMKDGREQAAKEIFKCSRKIAAEAFFKEAAGEFEFVFHLKKQ